MSDTTADYYERHAARYFRDTVAVDLSAIRSRFLARIAPGGQVLDAGCGAGRDARAFRDLGFRVTAFDASPALAALAGEYLAQPVRVLRLQDIDWVRQFDGIWACASLLHVPRIELPAVLDRLARALRPGGVLYASFKYGAGEHEQAGRRFTDLDEDGLADLLARSPGWRVLDRWISTDCRPAYRTERWFNVLLTTDKSGSDPDGVRPGMPPMRTGA